MIFTRYVYFLILLSIISVDTYSQSYGLEFAGHEVVQDKRTGLNLGGDQKLCLSSFQFEFKLSFLPGRKDYFGYIFRIIDEEKRNIDLIYDMRFAENRHFKLVIGDKVTDIIFDIPIKNLFDSWYKLVFIFDVKTQQLSLQVDGKRYTQKLRLRRGCYSFLFGASNFDGLSIKDVPPMKIRDVIIKEEGADSYNWPLNESSGLKVTEIHKGKYGVVANPVWIKKKHYEWELINNFQVQGPASIAFNPLKEEVYTVAEHSISVFHVLSNAVGRINYSNSKQVFLRGNQSLFDKKTNQLYNFLIDQAQVLVFDFAKKSWGSAYKNTALVTDHVQANKFYSSVDSSIYMLGGYGQYTYRRSVSKFNVPEGKWTAVEVTGDFTPRYLAALGSVEGGAYILGGYGSSTGEQILKPRNVYDLNYFDVKKRTFKKILQLNPKSEEFAFANSMIIDESSGVYYALTFPNSKYKSSLQLIKGSVTSPDYELVGNSLPYDFHDVNSFSDLFYSPTGKKYIAVTLLYDLKTNTTSVKIYSLLNPPGINSIAAATSKPSYSIIFTVSGLIVVTSLYLFLRNLNAKKQETNLALPYQPEENGIADDAHFDTLQVEEIPKNTIFLFGNLQLNDRKGDDVTKQFSPLMKELFLLILLYTTTRSKGISSEKLNDILWFDKSVESARNNRSVNIAKLRAAIDQVDGCQVSIENGKWLITMDKDLISVDYMRYLQLIKSRRDNDIHGMDELTGILTRGNFLSNVEYDWLDSFKSEISNEIVDTYLYHANSAHYSHKPEVLIKIADQILSQDTMNEEAIAIKCKALVKMGKHTLASTMFDHFRKEFRGLYGEDYKLNFREILAEE